MFCDEKLFPVIVRSVLQAKDMSNDSKEGPVIKRYVLFVKDYNRKATSVIARHALQSKSCESQDVQCVA